MRNTSVILMVIMAATLTACATKQVLVSEAMAVPRDRIMAFDAPRPDATSVTFIRDRGMMGGGCYLELFVDSIASAKMDTGEKVTLFIPNGRHDVYAKFVGHALCQIDTGANRSSRATELVVEKDRSRLMRIATDDGGITTITPYIQ